MFEIKDEKFLIKSILSYLSRHATILKKWKYFCKDNSMCQNKFVVTVATRWNSAFNILVDKYFM